MVSTWSRRTYDLVCVLTYSAEEARELAGKMIGNKLITKQTGAGGRLCNAVMIAEARTPKHEYYVALLNDRVSLSLIHI